MFGWFGPLQAYSVEEPCLGIVAHLPVRRYRAGLVGGIKDLHKIIVKVSAILADLEMSQYSIRLILRQLPQCHIDQFFLNLFVITHS
jgi:hypothetical protein